MPSPPPTGFDESKHPRGQPDNPGKFKSRPLPTPPEARPRRRSPGRDGAARPSIKVHIEDEDALSSPDPEAIHAYLRQQGWQRRAEPPPAPDIWELPTPNGTYQVLAPSPQRLADYPRRVSELLRTLSIAEDRSELDILADFLSVQEAEPSNEAMEVAAEFSWDEAHIELADAFTDDEAQDGPDPVEEEWRGVNCADCGQPMISPDRDVVESLTLETVGGKILHWHPACWLIPTSDTTHEFRQKAARMRS